jgi:putative redox protein
MAEVTINVAQRGEITSEASIRNHKVIIDRPEAKGGEDKGAMGGELFLAGLGGCFLSNLLAAISARGVSASDMSVVVTGQLEDVPPRFTSVTMTIKGKYSDNQEMEKLAKISEKGCIVANSVKDSILLDIIIS